MRFLFLSLFFTSCVLAAAGQSKASLPLSEQLSRTAMTLWTDSFTSEGRKAPKWSYDQGVILKGIEKVWYATGNVAYFNYIQKSMDYFVQDDGSIKGYRPDEYNIDHLNNGKLLLSLYKVTGKAKYLKGATLLRKQLLTHPRTTDGGFWHKKIYPWQMWLDGLYMGQPFYAEYAALMHEDSCFNDITRQFVQMEAHARNAKTGLLYHGWDESKTQKWANAQTGLSPHYWGRALGWYGMALVDVLDYFPINHPGRAQIIAILNRFATAVTNVQDKASGLWYDIVDLPKQKGNYKEASASCMLVYTLAKAVRNGYISEQFKAHALRGYEGIQKEFIRQEKGQTNLYGTVAVSGLGGNPYRDGSFTYYTSEKVIENDPKGIGAFILCASEMEIMATAKSGKGKTVLLDRYYNSEKRLDAGGKESLFHYTWDEKSNPGFYVFGKTFEQYGAKLGNLDMAPTAATLKDAAVYIIVDIDHEKDKPNPNPVTEVEVEAISNWVKNGGSLLLMANDSANCNLDAFNQIAKPFGIFFTNKSINMVKNDHYPTGLQPTGINEVFTSNLDVFLKEISTLELSSGATPLVKKDKDIIIAVAKYGKGRVLAVGDPWLYNEYVDGRKLQNQFDNFKAAQQLAYWLLNK